MPLQELEVLASRILRRAGLRGLEAEQMASFMVYAQASGIDSHGLAHLPHYVGGIVHGTIRPRPDFRFLSTRPGAAVMDADDGPGVLAAVMATDRVIQLARAAGLGAVAVRNSGHFGVASAYVDRIVSRGMVGFVMSNASPSVAPRGGTQPAFGTNPIAAGFPRADGVPVVVDFATTVGSRARIRKAKLAGESIPEDWALDDAGQPTCDPDAALRGTMQALGGAKGTSIGLLVELFCVVLSGGLPGTEVRPPQDYGADRSGVSHLFLAFDPVAFTGLESVSEKVAQISHGIEAMESAYPGEPVRMPGSRAAAERQRTQDHGVYMTSDLVDALRRAEVELVKLETFDGILAT